MGLSIECLKCKRDLMYCTYYEVRFEHLHTGEPSAVFERHYECYGCGTRLEITTLEDNVDMNTFTERDEKLWAEKQK